MAVGDSYNDIAMLQAADVGALFHPPANVVAEFPEFPAFDSYADLGGRGGAVPAGRAGGCIVSGRNMPPVRDSKGDAA